MALGELLPNSGVAAHAASQLHAHGAKEREAVGAFQPPVCVRAVEEAVASQTLARL